MTRKQLKTFYRTDNPLVAAGVAALNELGQWCNTFDSIRPIMTHAVPGGVKLRWEPWESPFVHPWRVWQPDPSLAKVSVAGGSIHRGDEATDVSGLSNVTASDGLRVWLSVKHYHHWATASEYTLTTGTSAFPASSNSSSYSLSILPVAEISGSTLYQYLYDNQSVPRINPPLPDSTNTYFLMSVAGTVQWVLTGECG